MSRTFASVLPMMEFIRAVKAQEAVIKPRKPSRKTEHSLEIPLNRVLFKIFGDLSKDIEKYL